MTAVIWTALVWAVLGFAFAESTRRVLLREKQTEMPGWVFLAIFAGWPLWIIIIAFEGGDKTPPTSPA